MRRFFNAVGVILSSIVVLSLVLFGVAAYRSSTLGTESKAFVDEAVADIGVNWDEAELIRRASPALLNHEFPQQLAALFKEFTKFGHFIRYDGAKGEATVSIILNSNWAERAHYEASATYENGRAHFRIDLTKHDGRWMIDGFFVDMTPILTNPIAKPI